MNGVVFLLIVIASLLSKIAAQNEAAHGPYSNPKIPEHKPTPEELKQAAEQERMEAHWAQLHKTHHERTKWKL
jgi:hypothetical protein